jgi:hypothetical protein
VLLSIKGTGPPDEYFFEGPLSVHAQMVLNFLAALFKRQIILTFLFASLKTH